MNAVIFLVFFFQAEDGIRDADVTGVQTCALPISGRRVPWRPASTPARRSARAWSGGRPPGPRGGSVLLPPEGYGAAAPRLRAGTTAGTTTRSPHPCERRAWDRARARSGSPPRTARRRWSPAARGRGALHGGGGSGEPPRQA